MTITILVTTDAIATHDLDNCVEALNHTLAKWAPKWGITAIATTDSKVKADIIIKVTDKQRHTGAYGYHALENNVPTAWCSPKSVGRTYGHYTAPLYSREVKILGKVIKPAKLIHGPLYTSGLVTVIIHECLEMLADAHIDQYSKPDRDSREWLIEVADHVAGAYSIETVNGNICVIPDATYPSYYDINAVAPYDLCGAVSAPFARTTSHFYGYYKNVEGRLVAL